MGGAVPAGSALVVVAHPDDETLWVGGTILMHPTVDWTILALCRKTDPDRNPKFFRVVRDLKAQGVMGDMDDGPEQRALQQQEVEKTIRFLVPRKRFDLVVSHGPHGEYTRHRRHEETSRAVQNLWLAGGFGKPALWLFAYEDGGGRHPPRAIETAHRHIRLESSILQEKIRLITDLYGFTRDSFEARAVSDLEAFFCFHSATELNSWLEQGETTQ